MTNDSNHPVVASSAPGDPIPEGRLQERIEQLARGFEYNGSIFCINAARQLREIGAVLSSNGAVLVAEVAKHLSPDNQNVRNGDVAAAIRDLAQIAISEKGNAEEAERQLASERAARETLEPAVRTVLDTFSRDEAQGFRSRDRQFTIEILGAALDGRFSSASERVAERAARAQEQKSGHNQNTNLLAAAGPCPRPQTSVAEATTASSGYCNSVERADGGFDGALAKCPKCGSGHVKLRPAEVFCYSCARAFTDPAERAARAQEPQQSDNGACDSFRAYHAEPDPTDPDARCARCSRPQKDHAPSRPAGAAQEEP